jgi:hypothetical protein
MNDMTENENVTDEVSNEMILALEKINEMQKDEANRLDIIRNDIKLAEKFISSKMLGNKLDNDFTYIKNDVTLFVEKAHTKTKITASYLEGKDEDRKTVTRPLSGTPIHIRSKMGPLLPEFMVKFAEAIHGKG